MEATVKNRRRHDLNAGTEKDSGQSPEAHAASDNAGNGGASTNGSGAASAAAAPATAAPDTVGNLLLRTREKAGLSVEDIASVLRINWRYVQAIEEERYTDLPGRAYAVGFVRAYAEYFNLDAPDLVERFKREVTTISDQQTLSFPEPVSEGRSPTGALIFISLLLCAAAYGVWVLTSGSDSEPTPQVAEVPARLQAVIEQPVNQPANQPTNEATPGTPAAPTDTRSTVESITVTRQTLNTIQTEIESELRSNVNRSEPANGFSEGNTPTPQANRAPGDRTADNRTETSNEALAADRIFTTSFSLILLAVAMGALGSTISVIVRATTFIRQAQENDNDLFLTGFFRPFVGMSFAIFCVALVEAGIFSGIFDLTNRKDTDRTYFYVAIAFVAGFSERLVRDVVLKTEDTIAGPNGNNNRWRNSISK